MWKEHISFSVEPGSTSLKSLGIKGYLGRVSKTLIILLLLKILHPCVELNYEHFP
jgi:hypothetical protein